MRFLIEDTTNYLSDTQIDKLENICRKLNKYDLYYLAYNEEANFDLSITPKEDLFEDAMYELVDLSVDEVNKRLAHVSEYKSKLLKITESLDEVLDSCLGLKKN